MVFFRRLHFIEYSSIRILTRRYRSLRARACNELRNVPKICFSAQAIDHKNSISINNSINVCCVCRVPNTLVTVSVNKQPAPPIYPSYSCQQARGPYKYVYVCRHILSCLSGNSNTNTSIIRSYLERWISQLVCQPVHYRPRTRARTTLYYICSIIPS